jgi:hypothetical protein
MKLIWITVSLFMVQLGSESDSWADTDQVCHVGAQFHLHSNGVPEESYLRHLRAFVEEGMADYGMLLAHGLKDHEIDEVVRYLAEHDVRFLLQETFPYSPDWFTSANSDRRYDAEDYERIRAIAGDRFLGVHWGEIDSSGLKPEDYLVGEELQRPSRRKVKEAFTKRIRERLACFHDRFKTPYSHSCGTLSHHLFAEAGFDMLCSEIGENIPNVNMMIALNRGVARAYDRPWMIDHSTWWAPRGHAGEQVSPREGHTPWCFFTSLLGAAMGGADYVQLEVDWAAYDREFKLRPWGQALKTLFAVTREIGPRGTTATPFALLIGHENGWPGVGWRVGDVRGTGLFDGIRHSFMQTRDADLSLKIWDVFYPGFERCGWDPEYPGFLAESPLGTLDMVPDNLDPDKYDRYKVLVAIGYHRMTQSLRDKLLQYVENGGVLVCGDSLFLDEFEEMIEPDMAEPLVGCILDSSEENLIHLNQPRSELDEIPGYVTAATHDVWQNHWLRPVRLTTGRAVARFNIFPYIVENRIGSGHVFFVTALNMVGSDQHRRGPEPFLYANTLYHFLHSLENHIGDGICFSPWTGLEHIFNHKSDGTGMLLVMNHGDMPYRRDAVMHPPNDYSRARVVARGNWEGWESGDEIQFTYSGEELAWSFEMDPKSFVLFEFRQEVKGKERTP